VEHKTWKIPPFDIAEYASLCTVSVGLAEDAEIIFFTVYKDDPPKKKLHFFMSRFRYLRELITPFGES